MAAFQNPDGGFGAKAGDKSSLGSTSSAIRALKNARGSIPDVPACIKYVLSCRDAESGGFAPTPGGKPNVRSTAVGLMAATELQVADDSTSEGAIGYFTRNVQRFEDIRIAVAGLEAVKKTSPDFKAWTARVEADRNPDGTWGKGSGRARDTGCAVVALLRMSVKLDKKDAILAALRAGQQPDGGWGKGEGDSDLESTYRIMRAFFMLQEKPDLEKLRGFIARCRQSDGGYAVKPGDVADIGGTYFATTVLRWVRLLDGKPERIEATSRKLMRRSKTRGVLDARETLSSSIRRHADVGVRRTSSRSFSDRRRSVMKWIPSGSAR